MAHGRAATARRIVVIAAMAATASVAFGAPALAQSSDTELGADDQIVLNGRLEVAEGETIDTAVIFNGPATIDGTVRKGVFVFSGDTEISGTVEEDVIVLNGDVVVRSGAVIGGDLVTQGTVTVEDGATVRGSRQNVATRFDFEGLGFASRFVWWVGYSASTLVLGLVLLLLLPRLDASAVASWREQTGPAIGWGAAVFFLLPFAAILLLLTIVALPLGVIVLLGLALLYSIGYVVGAAVVGRLLVKPPTSRFLAFLVGWVILRGIALVPFVASLTWLAASIVGLGVILVSVRRPSETPALPTAPPPPPVPA